MYRIIKTRKNAYQILIETLKLHKQSGAVKILETASPLKLSLPPILSYDRQSIIGTGYRHTKVYKGKYGKIDVAVKRVNTEDLDKKAETEIERYTDMTSSNSKNIVRYLHAKQEGSHLLIVLELCDYNLAEYLKKQTSSFDHRDVLWQITEGLHYLHEFKILHLDIKPENILIKVDTKGRSIFKIADFGVSKKLVVESTTDLGSSGIGTDGWIAPEILQRVENPSQRILVVSICFFVHFDLKYEHAHFYRFFVLFSQLLLIYFHLGAFTTT